MIRHIAKKIREVPVINRGVRSVIRTSSRGFNFFSRHWPAVGIVELRFNNRKIKYFTRGDDHVANAFYYEQPWEYAELNIFLQLATKSKVIFDIGANTGIYSCFTSLFCPTSTIFAFEPNALNRMRLEQNIQINGLTNIEVSEKAVGAEVKTVEFAVPVEQQVSYTSSVDIEFAKSIPGNDFEWQTISVSQITLDQFILDKKLEKVDLLKIDVEGYEISVFNGASQMIRSSRPVILVEIFFSKERKEFFRHFLSSNSYKAYSIVPNGLCRCSFEETEEQISSNFLLLPFDLGSIISSNGLADTLRYFERY